MKIIARPVINYVGACCNNQSIKLTTAIILLIIDINEQLLYIIKIFFTAQLITVAFLENKL